MTLMDILMLVLLVAVTAVGLFFYQKTRDRKDTVSRAAAPGSGEPHRDAKANAAFVRRLKASAWKRGLPLVVPNPERSPFCALLVSPSGVTAYWGADQDGTVYGGPDEQWAQISGGGRRPFRNPMLAAEDARKQLRDALTAAKFGAFLVNAKVVMPATGAELAIPRNTPVVAIKDALHEVEYGEALMTNRRVDEEALQKFLQENYG